MAAPLIIRPEALTRDVFSPFGEVLETDKVKPEPINFGNTDKFGGLAEIALINGGKVQLSIYRSRAIELPFRVQLMECHPLGSQAFYPLHKRPFPVIVAAADVVPEPANLRVFLTNGQQGVCFHPGTWHHYQLTLERESDYLVVDRVGDTDNYREFQLDQEVLLTL
jgi:ureidoglycolate lyase